MDFTIKKYKQLISSLHTKGYSFQTFEEYLKSPQAKSIILRHDVDLRPHNSLLFAKIQNKFGIKGTYYFRAVPESWDERVIEKIASLEHEIGYHYECLTTCNGSLPEGIKDFEKNLKALRKLTHVSTICMHGSPMSKYDSKDLWNKYNYADFDILGEPYFDLNFNEIFYITDTGRMWDGDKVSVRDKVNQSFKQKYHSTNQILRAIRRNKLPDQIMFTFHPQRWHKNPLLWVKELIFQNIKNIFKRYFYV